MLSINIKDNEFYDNAILKYVFKYNGLDINDLEAYYNSLLYDPIKINKNDIKEFLKAKEKEDNQESTDEVVNEFKKILGVYTYKDEYLEYFQTYIDILKRKGHKFCRLLFYLGDGQYEKASAILLDFENAICINGYNDEHYNYKIDGDSIKRLYEVIKYIYETTQKMVTRANTLETYLSQVIPNVNKSELYPTKDLQQTSSVFSYSEGWDKSCLEPSPKQKKLQRENEQKLREIVMMM